MKKLQVYLICLASMPALFVHARHDAVLAGGLSAAALSGLVLAVEKARVNRLEEEVGRLRASGASEESIQRIRTQIATVPLYHKVARVGLPVGGILAAAGFFMPQSVEGNRDADSTQATNTVVVAPVVTKRPLVPTGDGVAKPDSKPDSKPAVKKRSGKDGERAIDADISAMIDAASDRGVAVSKKTFVHVPVAGDGNCGFHTLGFFANMLDSESYEKKLFRAEAGDIAQIRRSTYEKMKELVEQELAALDKAGIRTVRDLEDANKKEASGYRYPWVVRLASRFNDAEVFGYDSGLSRQDVCEQLLLGDPDCMKQVAARLNLTSRYKMSDDQIVASMRSVGGVGAFFEAVEQEVAQRLTSKVKVYVGQVCADIDECAEMSDDQKFMYIKQHPDLAAALLNRFALPRYTGAIKPGRTGTITEEDHFEVHSGLLDDKRAVSAQAWIGILARRQANTLERAASEAVPLRPLAKKMLGHYRQIVGEGENVVLANSEHASAWLDKIEFDVKAEEMERPILIWERDGSGYKVASISGKQYWEKCGKEMTECMHVLNEGNGHWSVLVPEAGLPMPMMEE